MTEPQHLPHDELQAKAAHGVSWNLMSTGAQRAVVYISTLLLAHLLRPADFGLVAIASTVIYASSILRDLGLGDTLIQRPDLDRAAQGTVLTLMLLTALLAAGALAGMAPVLATFFHEPRLTSILLALAPVLAIGGLTGFYDNVLQREFQNRVRFNVGLVQSVLYVAISVGLALAGVGVWSLIAAQLVSVAVTAVVQLRLAAAYIVRPTFHRAAARDTLRNGRAFLAGGALDFIRQNSDYISIARFLSVTQLSFYASAYRTCDFLGGSLSDAFTRVSFASFSRLRAEGQDLRPGFLATLRLVGLISCPVGVLLSGLADRSCASRTGTSGCR
jgi:lipopolysaccharide exporter